MKKMLISTLVFILLFGCATAVEAPPPAPTQALAERVNRDTASPLTHAEKRLRIIWRADSLALLGFGLAVAVVLFSSVRP